MHYTDISPEFTKKFFELVATAERVVICGHISPDEDSISSVLAVYDIILQKQPGKETRIIYTGKPDERWASFKNYDKIQFVEDIASEVKPGDTLIVVDGSQLHRFSRQPEKLAAVTTKICIDHHASPVEEFTLSLVAPQYPAAAEVIYRAFASKVQVSKELAEIFLMGILGDTNTFTYLKPSQSGTLTVAKELLDMGKIDIQELKSRYDVIMPREYAVMQEFVKNSQYGTVEGWPDFQYSFVSREFMTKGNYTNEEVSGGAGMFKSHVRKVKGYTWGFSVRPSENGDAYISCRSLPGSVNVRDLMERLQLGGGHDRAAAGAFKKQTADIDSPEALGIVLKWMEQNKPVLS